MNPLPGDLTYEYWKAVHAYIFQDMYEWAGRERQHSIAKHDVYCYPQYIKENAVLYFGRLKNENYLRGLDRATFAKKASDLMADLYHLHPFREGNTRSLCIFMDELCRRAGYQFEFQSVDWKEIQAALYESVKGHNQKLHSIFVNHVGPINKSIDKEDLKMDFTVDQTQKAYQEALASITGELNQYREGKLVEGLLRDGHAVESLKQAIAKNSPLANAEGKLPMGYATHMVNRSSEVLQTLNEVKDVKTIVDARSAYQMALQKQLDDPTVKLNSSLDSKIAAGLIRNGYSLEEVQSAIASASPIAREAGRSVDNYSKYVVEQAVVRNEKYAAHQNDLVENYPATASEYISRMEKAREALASSPGKEITSFNDGQIVSDMLKSGCPRDNVIKAVSEISPVAYKLQEEKGVSSDKYARGVVLRVEESIGREEKIDQVGLMPSEGQNVLDYLKVANPASAMEAYLYSAKHYMSHNPEAHHNAFVDAQISHPLLQKYPAEEIQKAVSEMSPAAIQPGRNAENYGEFVVNKVRETIQKDNITLAERKLAVAVSTAEKSGIKDINYDYSRQAGELLTQGKWEGQGSDIEVARNLMRNGYDKLQVTQAIKAHSPEVLNKPAKEAQQYTKTTLQQVMTKDFAKELKKMRTTENSR